MIIVLIVGQSSRAPQSESSNQPGYNPSVKTNAHINVSTPQADVAAKQDSSQQTPVAQPNKSAPSQPSCVKSEIPYKTTYQDAPYLQKGQTNESDGANGFILDCHDGKPIVVNPVDKHVYVGTAPTDAEIQQQQIAAQQALDAKQMQWNLTVASAYQSCRSSLPSNYPSRDSFCMQQAEAQAGTYPR